MTSTLLLVNLLMLGVVLESDLGRRKIGIFRIGRPLLSLPVVLTLIGLHPARSGNGLLLDLVGVVVGVLLGLAASALMTVEYDPLRGRAVSRAGIGYAAVWVAIVGARLLFSYGSDHWFGRQIGQFLLANRISVDAFAASFILMAFAMALTRTANLALRAAKTRPATRPAVSVSQ
jgi:hypothetical protein